MQIVTRFADARSGTGTVGLVPTMGYLHEGHVSLLEAARDECDHVVMSLFVNPLQFDEMSDLERYPRDLGRDATIAEDVGVDVVLAPPMEEMYPVWPPATAVHVADLTREMEGAQRPGHFDGVATVVAKLFAGVQPDLAYFGRKDAQQLAVVRAMARDLSYPVGIRGMPIVREADGLALSSRNVFLDPSNREAALSLSRGLMDAADAVEAGERDVAVLVELVIQSMTDAAGVEPEYAAVADQDHVVFRKVLDRPSFLAVAARVGEIRLIDNVHLDVAGNGTIIPDRGLHLQTPSVLYGGRPS
jgi:pantoate--beta-alanine ligase